jgi:hypothetical protein
MWDYLWSYVAECLDAMWRADSRPEARRFTVGCAVVVVVVIGLLALYYSPGR